MNKKLSETQEVELRKFAELHINELYDERNIEEDTGEWLTRYQSKSINISELVSKAGTSLIKNVERREEIIAGAIPSDEELDSIVYWYIAHGDNIGNILYYVLADVIDWGKNEGVALITSLDHSDGSETRMVRRVFSSRSEAYDYMQSNGWLY